VKTSSSKKGLDSIIDANINRAKEGLRVCEDIARFSLGSKKHSARLKSIRHSVGRYSAALGACYLSLLKSRDSAGDAGRRIKSRSEFSRGGLKDVLASNFKRAEESLRVLEEMGKLVNIKAAAGFKELRYRTYEAEKSVLAAYAKKNRLAAR